MVTGAVIPSVASSSSACCARIFIKNVFAHGLKGRARVSSSPNSSWNSSFSSGAAARRVAARCLLHGVGGGGSGFWEDGDSSSSSSSSPGHNSSSSHFSFPSSFKKDSSVLWSLIQDIDPLDVSTIQRDVSSDTLDAMKRTISGMLGLLPSDQFNVSVEAFWVPLSRLLVSSMMTGYTLRNAEYRLCLQKSLYLPEDSSVNDESVNSGVNNSGAMVDSDDKCSLLTEEIAANLSNYDTEKEDFKLDIPEGLGKLSPEAEDYIKKLQSQLLQVSKELQESELRNATLQMQSLAGEEKNDLLDYLRSLEPEKWIIRVIIVSELSEPTSSEVQEVIQRVIHGLLATLSPKMYARIPPHLENGSGIRRTSDENNAEVTENASLQFQPLVSVSRDFLARLLFWCMLLGHHIRGLEYRLDLNRMLSFSDITGISGKRTCGSNDVL